MIKMRIGESMLCIFWENKHGRKGENEINAGNMTPVLKVNNRVNNWITNNHFHFIC